MTLVSCAEWGARPVDNTSLRKRPAAGVVLHHTAGANTAPFSDVAGAEEARCFDLARSIQRAHLRRGWRDSGHHFLISRSGRILEGRHGSIAAARAGRVIHGAHAGNNAANRTMWGLETEGTYTHELPPPAQWDAMVELCAWLCLWGEVQSRELHGHRIYRATQCPGDLLFARLPELRRAVHDRKTVLMEDDRPPRG